MKKRIATVLSAAALLTAQSASADVKTEADREALFDMIVEMTMAREAWSPVKNDAWGASYPEDFEPFRQQVIDAQTDEDLFYALVKLSNTRHDSHLGVSPVKGGLVVPETPHMVAPVMLRTDFGGEDIAFFVADKAMDLDGVTNADKVSVGDRVVEINGMSVAEYVAMVRPYFDASTERGLRMHVGISANQKSDLLPERLYGDTLELVLKPKRGRKYSVSAPYKARDAVEFHGVGKPTYPGFDKVFDFESFDFYVSNTDRKVVLFDWYGFRDDIVESMDAVILYADEKNLLDHDVIWDGSQSRGGGRGAYAIQRLQPKPFKTTFGNVRISDVVSLFIAGRKAFFDRSQAMSDGTLESVGDGSWLIDWLLDDVTKGIEAGQAYSNDVPFKLAHAPKYSDGILYPAETHFRGKMVCWLGPKGGSHLDQFATIVADNDLCPILGMPAGGYSNTWEWEETLFWPGTEEPVVEYMWNIGHTIRPNGQVLEGNPADVDEYIPVTAENYANYYDILLNRTFEILDNERD